LLRLSEALYDFSGGSVEAFARGLDDSLERVMLFGHNHAFTALANAWGNRGIDNVPTTGVVHLRFEAGRWADLSKGQTRLTVFPRNLK
jgi:phosphohistidine phosphatase